VIGHHGGMRPRPATVDDLATLAQLRTEFLAEVRGVSSEALPAHVVDDNRAFFVRTMAAGNIRSWLAELDGIAVGIVSLVLHDVPPQAGDPRTHEGYVINMYVRPGARGRGLARDLLRSCTAVAGDHGIRRFSLIATGAGRPLYEQAGFVSNPSWMEMRVPRG